MVVGIDLDGVLRNFVDSFDRICLDIYGKKRLWSNYNGKLGTGLGVSEQELRDLIWRKCPFQVLAEADIYPGSLEMLHDLEELGVEIAVVTYQPTKGAKAATWEWMNRNGVLDCVDHMIMLGGEYGAAELDKAGVYLDILLDDTPENVISQIQSGRWGVLFSRPWNVGYNLIRVERHSEFVALVQKTLANAGGFPIREEEIWCC